MKTIIFFYVSGIVCAISNTTEWTEGNRRKEADQVALWESKLVETQDEPPNVRLRELSLGLRNMGHRRGFEGHSPAVEEAYLKIQQELLSIPGHAKYYADELERLRLDPKSNYERIRPTYLAATLRYLPSPETIQVLGDHLSDMRDTPIDENPKYHEAVSSGKLRPIDWAPTPQNAWLATYALSNIGLQDPPFEPVANYSFIRYAPSTESLQKFRVWWEEVKSGKRTFSFKGQNVEYRFKPDGTWETISLVIPPDNGTKDEETPEQPSDSEKTKIDDVTKLKEPIVQSRESKRMSPVESETLTEKTVDFQWILVSALLVMAMVCGIWIKRRAS